jgi:hypothetical protein
MRTLACIVSAVSILFTLVFGKTCLVLPIAGQAMNDNDKQTTQDLFIEAFTQAYPGQVSVYSGTEACQEPACARQLGKAQNADDVVYLVPRQLGESIIVTGRILAVTTTDEGQQVRLTAKNIEDLEQITKRLADALATGKNVGQAATTENIVAAEAHNEPSRRSSILMGGMSVGYFYPLGNSYQELDIEEDFFHPGMLDTTATEHGQFIRIKWKSWYEFRENMVFSVDAHWLALASFGATFNYHYLFSTKDFTPYAITGLGLEFVYNDKSSDIVNDSKRYSGPLLNLGLGYLGFRTYDIHFFLQATYSITFNSDRDNGVVLELGSVYRRAPPQNKTP